ncbi:MAG TPA: MinD/ParA family protein [Nocardioides sp.]|jgi:putative peptide zinc metalloprotease protein|nr:MinD/ParA family protein [Nocardioides sp.]
MDTRARNQGAETLARPSAEDDEGHLVAGWRVVAGVTDLGSAQDTGLRQRTYLVRRADGQVIQLSDLLYLVLGHLDPRTTSAEIADSISMDFGRRLSPDGLRHLVETRLIPLGLVSKAGDEPPPAPRANPLLSLTFRGTLLPASAVRSLSRGLTWWFLPPVVVVVLAGFVAMDIALVLRGDLLSAFEALVATPVMLLLILLVINCAAVVHELGHAAACRYGGASPGRIGVGVYIVYPAYFTEVTDSYRLGRSGRLRTDLGGLYFNAWTVIVLGAGYLMTGEALLILTAAMLQVQMLQQLIPAVRFDGYYVLADLAGVPDLFTRVGPVLRSLLPGRPPDPRVTELRPHARRTVVAWVLVVVPLLAFGFGWLLWTLPFFYDQLVQGMRQQWTLATLAWPAGAWDLVAVALVSMVLLALPAIGLVVLTWRLLAMLLPLLARAARRLASREEAPMAIHPTSAPEPTPQFPRRPHITWVDDEARLTASEFTDANMLPAPRIVPDSGWRRAIHTSTGGVINPGPGPAQVRRQETEERLRAPIDGSRHVVVMSRKGGVGKTTMTLALGSTFASLRGDRVIAVDANPDAGNLAHRVATGNGQTITDVLANTDSIASYSQLREYTIQAPRSRLEVLASDDDPSIGMALHRDDYHRLVGLLDRFYNLLLLDTGTGILDSANQGLISEADQLVLVLRAGLDGGRAAALTLDWLDQHDHEDLVSRAVVVINGVRPGTGAPIEPMQEHFERRCRHVLCVPWDRALEVGAQTEIESLQRGTRDALVAVAAAVADNFREGQR